MAAGRAAATALRRHDPRAVVVSTTTAAMLAPLGDRPYAVRLDAPAALNRPGRRNAIQHALERRRLARRAARAADEPRPPSERCRAAARRASSSPCRSPRPAPSGPRGRLAVAYTPDPKAKGLDVLGEAWGLAAIPDARLLVYGMEAERGRAFLARFSDPGAGRPRVARVGAARRVPGRAAGGLASTSRAHAGRTGARRSSRRWPTAPCWPRRRPAARSRRSRSPARSTRGWSPHAVTAPALAIAIRAAFDLSSDEHGPLSAARRRPTSSRSARRRSRRSWRAKCCRCSWADRGRTYNRAVPLDVAIQVVNYRTRRHLEALPADRARRPVGQRPRRPRAGPRQRVRRRPLGARGPAPGGRVRDGRAQSGLRRRPQRARRAARRRGAALPQPRHPAHRAAHGRAAARGAGRRRAGRRPAARVRGRRGRAARPRRAARLPGARRAGRR